MAQSGLCVSELQENDWPNQSGVRVRRSRTRAKVARRTLDRARLDDLDCHYVTSTVAARVRIRWAADAIKNCRTEDLVSVCGDASTYLKCESFKAD
ncbi:unnamed protein product [Dibothriocephalus latus]|uniref:Uncharacterized protein n=1 Tax=Dibothriocephalus latus TaxID=60516 RepID=A0A3P7L5M7_DIBLA|nr:unnamed protein product [Dibothriocephalus latus]